MSVILKRVLLTILVGISIVGSLLYVLTGLKFTFDNGEFDGLVIGSTKENVLSVLSTNTEITSFKVEVEGGLYFDYDNLEKLEDIFKYEEFLIRRKTKVLCVVQFDAKKITKVTHLDDCPEEFELSVGMSNEVTVVNIKDILKSNVDLNLIPNIERRLMRVSNLTNEEVEYLNKYDIWGYSKENSYSYTRLHFQNHKLKMITYFWIPIEFP